MKPIPAKAVAASNSSSRISIETERSTLPLLDSWVRGSVVPLLAIVVGVVHVVIALRMTVPIIHGDEAGYLGNAAQILDGAGRTGEGYFAGYSILLIPAAAVTTSPLAFFTAALVTNAALAVGAFLLIHYFACAFFPEAPRGRVALAAFTAVMLPAPMMLSAVAMSDNALLVLVPLVALGMAAAERRAGSILWLVTSLAAGFAYWTNPRGIVVAGAYVIGAAASAWASRRFKSWVVLVLGPTIGMTLLGHFFNAVIVGGNAAPGTRPSELTDAIARIGDIGQWQSIVALIAGRISYLVIASAGLAFVGFIWIARGLWESVRARSGSGSVGAGVFLDVGIAATIVLSAVSFTRDTFVRADYVIYGRYSEIFLPTLTAIGAVVVLTKLSRRSRSQSAILAVGTAIGAAVVMRYGRPPLAAEAWINWLNVPSLWWVRDITESSYLGRMLLFGALTVAALWLAVVYHRVAGTLLITVGFVLASWSVVSGYAIAGSSARAEQTVLARHVETLESAGVEVTCIAIDWPGASFFHIRQYQFLLPQIEFIDEATPEADVCNLVVSPRLDFNGDEPATALVGSENHFPMRLWIRLDHFDPGEIRSLDGAGMFYDSVPPSSLQRPAMYRADVSAVSAARTETGIAAELVVRHVGAETPWLGSFAEAGGGGIGRVQLAVALVDETGSAIDEWRVPLPASLLPSEEVRVDVLRSLDVDPGAADLRLRIGLVHEGVTTFNAQGDLPVSVDLER